MLYKREDGALVQFTIAKFTIETTTPLPTTTTANTTATNTKDTFLSKSILFSSSITMKDNKFASEKKKIRYFGPGDFNEGFFFRKQTRKRSLIPEEKICRSYLNSLDQDLSYEEDPSIEALCKELTTPRIRRNDEHVEASPIGWGLGGPSKRGSSDISSIFKLTSLYNGKSHGKKNKWEFDSSGINCLRSRTFSDHRDHVIIESNRCAPEALPGSLKKGRMSTLVFN